MLTLGARYILSKPANALPLTESFCLLSREAKSGQLSAYYGASGHRVIGQASFKSILSASSPTKLSPKLRP